MTSDENWGKRPDIVNFRALFEDNAEIIDTNNTDELVIINDIPLETSDDCKAMRDLLYNIYEEDTIDVLPKCNCTTAPGIMPAEFNLGQRCPKCNGIVRNPYMDELSISRWIRSPEGVPVFIHPQIWMVLNHVLGVKSTATSFSPLMYLTDTRYRVSDKKNIRYKKLLELNIPRGYNNFCENFFDIMELVLVPKIAKRNKAELAELKTFLLYYRDCLFTEYIPLPDRMLFTMEKINANTLADKNITHILEGILNVVTADRDRETTDPNILGGIVANAITSMGMYYQEFGKSSIDPKPGIARKQTIGTREPFTARGIITSNWDVHDYRSLIPPWCIAMAIFRLHLINKMTRDGIPLRKQYDLLHVYQLRASRTMYKYFKEILKVDFEGMEGFPCEFNRNPTLDRLSGAMYFITDINKDPDIRSIFFSVLDLAGPNADETKTCYLKVN